MVTENSLLQEKVYFEKQALSDGKELPALHILEYSMPDPAKFLRDGFFLGWTECVRAKKMLKHAEQGALHDLLVSFTPL